jgi:hypothetical protein
MLTTCLINAIINQEIKTRAVLNMTKELVIGKDYYEIFGSNTTGSKKLIFNGGISWTAVMGDKSMTKNSQQQTDAAVKYINQPSYGAGIRI